MAYSICQIRIWFRAEFSETVHSVQSSFDADSLAKLEVLSGKMVSHQHHQRKHLAADR